jgi:DNA-binding NtrC family response regulator
MQMIEVSTEDNIFTILVLDDEAPIVKAMTRVLNRMPNEWLDGRLDIHGFTDSDEALASMRDYRYDLIVSDLRMPRIDGIEFLRQTLEIQPDAMRIVISGHADLPTVMKAINDTQVYRFIDKPWNDTELLMGVAQALRNSALQQENQRLADLVREQRSTISKHEAALRDLEAESPGITHVERDESGAIMLDESEFDDD